MSNEILDIPQHVDLFSKGYDSGGQNPLDFLGSEINRKAQTMFEAGVPSNFIMDGDTIVRLNLVDGYLQSPDYVAGVSGWRISKDLIETGNGIFRGDISAATGTFTGGITVGAGTTFDAGYNPLTKITTFIEAAVYTEFNSSSLIGNSNLKAYYRFSDGALTTDTTAGGHTLTAISAPTLGTGKFAGCADFAGDDAYSATDHADFKPAGNFSVALWVKTTSTTGDKYLFQSFSANTNMAGIYLRISDEDNVRFVSGKNSGVSLGTDYQRIDSTTTVADGNWHFIVATYDSSKLHLYIDGLEEGTGTTWANAAAFAATNYVRIGCSNAAGTDANFMNGSIDDLCFFNGKALTAAEIATLYFAGPTSVSAGDLWFDTGNNNTPYRAYAAGVTTVGATGWVKAENAVADWANIRGGTNSKQLLVGASNVLIDGTNKRIVINDGTNDRVLMGYLAGKF